MINVAAIRMQQFGVQFYQASLTASDIDKLVRFEVLNAGRESIISTDTAAIVRTEVLPLKPDLVVYYEGGNQFELRTVVPELDTADQTADRRRGPLDSAAAWPGEGPESPDGRDGRARALRAFSTGDRACPST